MNSNHHIDLRSLAHPSGMVRDPVCKAEINVDEADAREVYAMRTYYFCCDECAELFRASPESYVPRAAQA